MATCNTSPRCQVPGCHASLSALRAYYLRYHICEQHCKADEVLCDGEPCRFCQLCGRFHPLAAFNSGRRSCRARLAKHNERRKTLLERKANRAQVSYKSRRSQARSGARGRTADPNSEAETDCDHAPSITKGCSSAYSQDEMCEVPDNETLMQEFNLVLPSAGGAADACCAPCSATYSADQPLTLPLKWGATDSALAAPGAQASSRLLRSGSSNQSQQSMNYACPDHPGYGEPTSASGSPRASSGCTEASNMDTECGEQGLYVLWRQWGGDDSNLIEPSVANLLTINLAGPSCQARPGGYQPSACEQQQVVLQAGQCC